MNKQINLNFWVLILAILIAFMVGMWLHSGIAPDPNKYKHQYDSLNSIVAHQNNVIMSNELEKQKHLKLDADLKDKGDSLVRAANHQRDFYLEKHKELKAKWLAMDQSQLASEMKESFEKAHPTPLFGKDTVRDVAISRPVAVHFLESEDTLQVVSADLKVTRAELDVSKKRIVNLKELLNLNKIDSTAQATIIAAQADGIKIRDKEKEELAKAHKKELRKQKFQKWVATGAAVIATGLAIIAAVH